MGKWIQQYYYNMEEEERREGRRRQRQKALSCCKKIAAFLFSHIGLAGMVVAYSIMGGFLFKALEAPFESREKFAILNLKGKQIERIWQMAVLLTSDNMDKTNFTNEVRGIFLKFQQEVTIAVKDKGWDGNDSTDESSLQWSFAGALLYAVTVITTIGYGHVAPKTLWGRLVTIIYALVGIPLTFLYLSNIGNFMADCFRIFYKKICCDICCCQKCERQKKRDRLRLKRRRELAAQRNTLLNVRGADYGTGRRVPDPPDLDDDIYLQTPEICVVTDQPSASAGLVGGGYIPKYSTDDCNTEGSSPDDDHGVNNVSGASTATVRETALLGDSEDDDDVRETAILDSESEDDLRETAILDDDTGDELKHFDSSEIFSTLERSKETAILDDRTSGSEVGGGLSGEHDLTENNDNEHNRKKSLKKEKARLEKERKQKEKEEKAKEKKEKKEKQKQEKEKAKEAKKNKDKDQNKDEADKSPSHNDSNTLTVAEPKPKSEGQKLQRAASRKQQRQDTVKKRGSVRVKTKENNKSPYTSEEEDEGLVHSESDVSRRRSLHQSEESFVTAPSENASLLGDRSSVELEDETADAASSKRLLVTYNDSSRNMGRFNTETVAVNMNRSPEGIEMLPYNNMADLGFVEDPFDYEIEEEDEKVTVPISVCLILIAGYIFAGSVLFTLWEDWDYLTGSYFCFITLSTIGFGDIVPGTDMQEWASHEKLVLCALWLAFGLSLLAMCFNLMQEEVKEKCKWVGQKLGLLKDDDEG